MFAYLTRRRSSIIRTLLLATYQYGFSDECTLAIIANFHCLAVIAGKSAKILNFVYITGIFRIEVNRFLVRICYITYGYIYFRRSCSSKAQDHTIGTPFHYLNIHFCQCGLYT